MLNMIHEFRNTMADEGFNEDFLQSKNDYSMIDLVVMEMKEFEEIKNIEITGYDVITDPDKVNINEHMVNINYKRKAGMPDIPKYKYMYTNRVGEIVFHITITTNLNTKSFTKKILIPIEYDGFYTLNNKKWKALWQIVDASTYSQKGKITLKSRMPIIVYKSKKRPIMDHNGEILTYSTYSYALNSKVRRGAKAKVRFINPVMIFAAKLGLDKAIEYFELGSIIKVVKPDSEMDTDKYRYFDINEVVFRVDKKACDNIPFVGSFVAMMYNCQNSDFPVTYTNYNDTEYWKSRIGFIGAAKSKSLSTYYEKGKNSIYMIERLLNTVTRWNLRLPDFYKKDVYRLLKWMILNFDTLKSRNNMDLKNKRIRKNEAIVESSLGKKISENINKLIEKKSKSKLNTMDTLLELFNFPNDIIVNGMRNIGDLVKSDELVNDLTFLQDMSFSFKGPNSLGEQSSKIISQKYRNIHPSYMGRIDINVSSNSDVGMSGAFTPYMDVFNRFYFTPDTEPCDGGYKLHQEIAEYSNSDSCEAKGFPAEITFDSVEDYLKFVEKYEDLPDFDGLNYEEIRIVERPKDEPSNAVPTIDFEQESDKEDAPVTEADSTERKDV